MSFKYNWEKFPNIEIVLKKIYQNSIIKLEKDHYDKMYAKEFIEDIEDFLYCILLFNYDIDRIIKSLEKLEYISFQKPLYYQSSNKIISINAPRLPLINYENHILLDNHVRNNDMLTARERRKMYLFHGLTYNSLNFTNEETKEFSKIYSGFITQEHIKKNTEMLLNNGWILLKLAISQEVAESFTYFILKKQRPFYNYDMNKNECIVDSNKIFSNLEYCRLFQPILINFGKTLGKVGRIFEHSSQMIIYDLLKMAMKENFSLEVIAEYNDRGKQSELFQLLYIMGILLNAEYKKYNLKIIPNLTTTKEENDEYFDLFEKITDNLIALNKTDYSKSKPSIELSNDIIKYKILKFIRKKDI